MSLDSKISARTPKNVEMLSQKIKISNNTKELILTELKLESTIAHFVIKYTQKLGKHMIKHVEILSQRIDI